VSSRSCGLRPALSRSWEGDSVILAGKRGVSGDMGWGGGGRGGGEAYWSHCDGRLSSEDGDVRLMVPYITRAAEEWMLGSFGPRG
jgi:hypothetical protein